MATYKVLQDIEAEDKLFGPMTLKQFIFGAITIGIGYIQFVLISSPGLGLFRWPFVLLFMLPMLLFGFLAAPISREQPNDIWLLARLRFILKPHRRIWNQDGLSELVTITAPKLEIHNYTNGLSQTEVKSRLQALANTVDSRGWAVKNVDANLFAQPGYLSANLDSDRLVNPTDLPQDVPQTDITAADDMLDPLNNSTAQHLDQLVQASTQSHRQQAIQSMKPASQAPQKPADYWFLHQSAPQQELPMPADYATFTNQPVVAPGTEDVVHAATETEEEKALAERLLSQGRQDQSHAVERLRTIQPLHDREGHIVQGQQRPAAPTPQAISPQPVVQAPANPAILGLAHNDDLNVATIARQAQKLSQDDDEVVISLH